VQPVAKQRAGYVCAECGATFARWSGRCSRCEQWDTLEEVEARAQSRWPTTELGEACAHTLGEIPCTHGARIATGMPEFDRVLGGGMLPGSTILLGGEPGIGKSTILLQALGAVSAQGPRCLYISGEESLSQLKSRAERLGVNGAALRVSASVLLEEILALLSVEKPEVCVVDSVQMVTATGLGSMPGGLGQLKMCATELVRSAKQQDIALFLVGHVTKEGAIAGPRALEHLVDTVLYFESEKFQSLRILRAVKNRFGPVGEIGVFQMGTEGLREVASPSEVFLSGRDPCSAGSVVTSTIEGSRAVLVEIQALVGSSAYGTPERKVSGADYRRFSMLLAVLDRRVGLNLGGCDAFVNVAGGVRVFEPSADLPLALALASIHIGSPFPADAVAVGEVGLGGEVRAVNRIDERLKEAHKLGFSTAVVPYGNRRQAGRSGMNIHACRSLRDALTILRENSAGDERFT